MNFIQSFPLFFFVVVELAHSELIIHLPSLPDSHLNSKILFCFVLLNCGTHCHNDVSLKTVILWSLWRDISIHFFLWGFAEYVLGASWFLLKFPQSLKKWNNKIKYVDSQWTRLLLHIVGCHKRYMPNLRKCSSHAIVSYFLPSRPGVYPKIHFNNFSSN